jgi:hypothetical protein
LGNLGANLRAKHFSFSEALSSHQARHFSGDHMAIRMNRNQETTPLKGKTNASPRGSRPRSATKPHRFTLHLKQLLSIHLAANFFHRVQELAFLRGKFL